MGLWIEMLITCGLAAIVWGVILWVRSFVKRPAASGRSDIDQVRFTLMPDRIAHMSQSAMHMLDILRIGSHRNDLLEVLTARFGALANVDLGQPMRRIEIASDWFGDDAILTVSSDGIYTEITLIDHADAPHLFKFKQDAQSLVRVHDVVETAKLPIWQSNCDGVLILTNNAFRTLDEKIALDLHTAALKTELATSRLCVSGSDGKQRWYDVERRDFQDGSIFYGIDATEVVKAEQAQRNFVQTLTKTFATLSTGLAIFDRNRQLVLFNPALVDLTKLPAEFLSTRPNLLSVFDRLRDKHIMPEPKNYASWREELGHLVVAAAEGTYTEVWNLPSGETYRISGRPHPDGALAFLFEDITAEVSTTRKYRSELDFHYALLDQIDTAVAVFSVSGQLCITNDAHDDLWSGFNTTSIASQSITDASRIWQSQTKPNPFWGDLRDFVHQIDDRSTWRATIEMENGSVIDCHVIPLPDHHTAVTFQRVSTAPIGPQKIKEFELT